LLLLLQDAVTVVGFNARVAGLERLGRRAAKSAQFGAL